MKKNLGVIAGVGVNTLTDACVISGGANILFDWSVGGKTAAAANATASVVYAVIRILAELNKINRKQQLTGVWSHILNTRLGEIQLDKIEKEHVFAVQGMFQLTSALISLVNGLHMGYVPREAVALGASAAGNFLALRKTKDMTELLSSSASRFVKISAGAQEVILNKYLYWSSALVIMSVGPGHDILEGKAVSTAFFAAAALATIPCTFMPRKNASSSVTAAGETRPVDSPVHHASLSGRLGWIAPSLVKACTQQPFLPLGLLYWGCNAAGIENALQGKFIPTCVMTLMSLSCLSIYAWEKYNGVVEMGAEASRMARAAGKTLLTRGKGNSDNPPPKPPMAEAARPESPEEVSSHPPHNHLRRLQA